MTPPTHVRPWRLGCTVTALRAAFPSAKIHIDSYDPRAGFAAFVIREAIPPMIFGRELLSLKTTWAPRRLRIAAEVLNACEHEASITALVTAAVAKMERGSVIEVGFREEPKPPETPQAVVREDRRDAGRRTRGSPRARPSPRSARARKGTPDDAPRGCGSMTWKTDALKRSPRATICRSAGTLSFRRGASEGRADRQWITGWLIS